MIVPCANASVRSFELPRGGRRCDMRAIIEVLRSIGLWLATGGVRIRPLIITLPPPDAEFVPERRLEQRSVARDRRAAAGR